MEEDKSEKLEPGEPVSGESPPEEFQKFENLFIPITKIDAQKHEVYGYATLEQPDSTNEMLDYESSKPYFQEWSSAAEKRSGGKSKGNIRAMHGPVAAGKAISVDFDDKHKGVFLGSKITNPTEWDQVIEGTYTGYSVGGRYVRKWYDNGQNVMRYTADPREISLVDAPCVPGATFQMIKADGEIEKRPFKPAVVKLFDGPEGSLYAGGEFVKADIPVAPSPVTMTLEGEKILKQPETFSTLPLNLTVNLNYNVPPTAAVQVANNPRQQAVDMPTMASPVTDASPAASAPQAEAAYKIEDGIGLDEEEWADIDKADKPKGDYGPHAEAGYADPGYQTDKKPRYPLKEGGKLNEGHIRAAWNYIAKPKNAGQYKPDQVKKIKSKIIAAWKKVIDPDGPPAAAEDKEKGVKKTMDKADLASSAAQLLSTVRGQVADKPDAAAALDQLSSLFDVAMDQADLRQDSTMPAEASSAASTLGSTSITDAGPTTTNPTKADATSTPGKSTPTAVESDTKAPSSSSPSNPSSSPSSPSSSPSSSTSTPSVQKGENEMNEQAQPLSTTPPLVNVEISGQSVTDQHLPEFMAALEGGSLKKAQKIVRDLNGDEFEQAIFDEMVMKSQKRLLSEGQWTYANLKKGMLSRSMGFDSATDQELKKAIQIGDIPNIYLIRLAKLMLPLYAGLVRRLPQQTPPVGADKAQWRAELGTSNFNFGSAMSTAELNVGQTISETFLTFAAPYKRTTVNDKVSLEAVYGARGFDDPLQVAIVRALTLLIGTRERMVLGSNNGSIAAPVVTAGSVATGGTIGSGLVCNAYVTALTYRGWLAEAQLTGSSGGSSAGSVAGESLSGSATATTGSAQLTNSVLLTWPAIAGAVAYNVYAVIGAAPERWQKTVYVNTAVLSGSGVASSGSHPIVDQSAGSNGYEGLVPWCELSTVYTNAIPGKTPFFVDQSGSGLTTYAGGITEFDTLLSNMWTVWQTAPSLIVCSANGIKHLTKQLLTLTNNQYYRIEIGNERGTIAGGAFVTGYYNKFAPFADGTPRVLDVMAHPYMADGSYLFVSESVPYPYAREARGLALETLIPYTYFPLAQQDISYPFAMLLSETMECFHPGAQAAIAGVNVAA